MARKSRSGDTESRRGRKSSRLRKIIPLVFLVGLLIFVGFLPQMVTSRSILVSAINKYGGLAPLQVDLQSAEAGWFKPISVRGVELRSGDGKVLAKLQSVTTAKGLIGWLTNSSELGEIEIKGLESAIVASNGTTDLEQALQPMIDSFATPSTDETPASASSTTTGTIKIVDAKLLLMESGRSEKWLFEIPSMSVALPTVDQLMGPISLQAVLADVSGVGSQAPPANVGKIAVSLAQSSEDQSLELKAKAENVPVDFWHVVRARLPDMPIDEMSGTVSAAVAGKMASETQWIVDIQQLESRNLSIVAPTLVGPKPAAIQLVSAVGKASLIEQNMVLEGVQFVCDFGSANASATLPWPLEIPTVTQPFIPGGRVNATGSINLPKLVSAAESLIPMRENMQLLSGSAQFNVQQSLDAQQMESSSAKLTLSGLKANSGGQMLQWDDPLQVDFALSRASGKLQAGAGIAADFCSLSGSGTVESGRLDGNVDLELLQQRLSQWVDLPIETMSGSASLNANWKMTDAETITAEGQLKTTEMLIASTSGGAIREPAWNGLLQANAKMQNGFPSQVNSAKIELNATNERLTIDLQEPLALVAPENPADSLKPAAFSVTIAGDLANWKRRGVMWLAEPPELELGGRFDLAVGGQLDMNHLEVQSANWRAQPLSIQSPSVSIYETQMVGNFKGMVDTSDLSRLQVQQLQVQATSFSLGAQDNAAENGKGRVGRARYLVDLNQLLTNLNSPNSNLPQSSASSAGGDPVAQFIAMGRVTGDLQWTVNSDAAELQLTADANNLVFQSKTPGQIAAQELWSEPSATANIRGKWIMATSEAAVERLELTTPWLNYSGNVAFQTKDELSHVTSKGNAIYDAAALSQKLVSYTGGEVQMAGRYTMPIEAEWTASNDPNAAAMAGLKANTRIGWEQARVVGIEIGKSDVPVQIDNGVLFTAAEIPVSGGVLRWDMTSDLTTDEMVIEQKPMKVLENVAITQEMCTGWLKYVAPLLAEATRVDGRLSLSLNQARFMPSTPEKQTVAGQLVMHNAQIGPGPLSNSIISLVQQLDAIRKRDITQQVSTQQVWLDVPEQQVDFEMVDGNVTHKNLRVKIGDARIATSGSVNVNGNVQMLAAMPIPDNWVEKSPWLAGLRGQSLNFPIAGTLSSPRVNTDLLRSLGQQSVQGAAQGILQQGLSRGLEKLFGPPPTQPQTPQQ